MNLPKSIQRKSVKDGKTTKEASQITEYFAKTNKETIPKKASSHPTLNNNLEEKRDIYADALKIHSQNDQKQTIDVEGHEKEKLENNIEKLKAMLLDEKKAKETVIEAYNALKTKYVSNLQLLVKTQQVLLGHQAYVNCVSTISQPTTNGAEQVHQANGSSKDVGEDTGYPGDLQLMGRSIEQIDVAQHISHNNIVKLNSIHPQNSNDSIFIKTLMDILYENKETLKSRTVSGRSRSQNKQAITPIKINVMKQLFIKRVQCSSAENQEKIIRLNDAYINCLIVNAINNINRQKKN